MRASLEHLLRVADAPNPERAEALWAEYRAGGTGADAAFATLLAWYGLALYRRVWGFVRSDAADDVFQDVLAKWHQARSGLATFPDALRWVRTVAVRQCIDAHRKVRRRKDRERRASRPEGQPPADGPELREELAAALAKLPANQREVVALVFFEGLDQRAAAAALGLHRDTVKARLDAALGRLQKLVSAPAAVASAGAAGVSGALSARPIGPSIARLGELAEGAMARAAHSASRLGRVAAVFAVLAGAAGITLAAWPRPEPPPAPVAGTIRPAAPVEEETLQAKNARLARRDVVPLVIPQLEALPIIPKDNPVEFVEAHGFGSKVECNFQTAKPLLGKKPAGFKFRYCVLRRSLDIFADLNGTGTWERVNPDKPITWELSFPGLPRIEVVRGVEQAAAVHRAFDRLPGDERAEREAVTFCFGENHNPRPGELYFPMSWRGLAGNSRDLYFHASDECLYVLRDGHWQYGGYCPGWLFDADDTRLYRVAAPNIEARSIDPRDSRWVPLCPVPPPESGACVHLRVAGGRMFMTTRKLALWVRSLSDPDAQWVREPWGLNPDWMTVLGDRLVAVGGAGGRELIARPLTGGEWKSVSPMPAEFDPAQYFRALTTWKGRVLTCNMAGGAIHFRTLDPKDTWQVIGKVAFRPDGGAADH